MKIMKFGGTSVGSAERMSAVSQLLPTQEPVIVVLSAMSGTTNHLVQIGQQLALGDVAQADSLTNQLEHHYKQVIADLYKQDASKEKGKQVIQTVFTQIRACFDHPFSPASEKIILAQGELLSTQLFQIFQHENGISSVLLPALEFMKITPDEEPDHAYIRENLRKQLEQYPDNQLFITQGYICRNAKNEIDNLKRGGSDYTASIIGAAVKASEIQIWTDIDGMHNNDPRIVKNTYPIAELSFDEAAELAYFGAKILHPSSILPAQQHNIPVRLLNTMQPEAPGTTISSKRSGHKIKAVAAKDGIIAIKIKSSRMLLAYGFLRSVFEVFERFKTPIDMITTSEVAVSLTIDNATYLPEITEALQRFGSVEIDSDLTIVCVVGDFMEDRPGAALRVVQSLRHIPLRMISYGGSKNNISFLVNTNTKEEALLSINEGVFQEKEEANA
ncbi:aspartate kinase [Rufibacter glacialis]|uniref:Aspartokinase n=1 Tax=Rufibacter glacialis TaxID=1259555 RepID=A0A5M8QAW1_9BACT|nr:aspartate kinase [Rufibacter glacialis]KAA6431672.1 aspartate kinase [Rufibacter glacialis]GGK82554.1 aspartokinase [Rufibacter glacialis]